MIQNLKNIYHFFLAFLANIFFAFPTGRLKVIGITGTDGKTTTTHLIYHILKSAGYRASMISSVYATIAGREYDTGFHVTTPDIIPLWQFFQKSLKARDEFFVLETTSHALLQNRVFGVKYEVGVITNITHEHLDMHGSMPEYIKTKSRLLQQAKIPVANADDASFSAVRSQVKRKIYTYALKKKADFSLDVSKKLNKKLPEFNKYNYLAAYSVCRLLAVRREKILAAIRTFKLPVGRIEIVSHKPFLIINDFAHTPNAIHEILRSIDQDFKDNDGRIIHVFGAAGKRDSSKRPFMGEASAKFADVMILTEEDHRDENPAKIATEIAKGAEKKGFKLTNIAKLNSESKKQYAIIINRKEAIRKAIEIARKGDVVITTGKGHEKSLCRGKIEYPWDERKAILKAVKTISK